MDYTLPKEVKNILEKFKKMKFQIYIVGGAVRDLLAKRVVSDWDFTTDAKPDEILKIFPEGFYDNKFGTVGLETTLGIFEITTMRKEGVYKDHRHPVDVGWTNKIEEDLARRDFTINAIALGGILVDPFGGQDDIKNKIIRAVGNPDLRFKEDALRLIRAIRITTQLEYEIDPKTYSALKINAGLIREIADERVRDELFKILASENARLPSPSGEAIGGQAYGGIVKLHEAGLLQIILPEVEKCFGIVQEGPKHDRVYDIGEHSLLALKHTPSADPLVRFAALLHDIGKVDTVKTDNTGNVTFYNHDVSGGRKILEIAKRFNLSNKQTDKLYRLVRWHLFTVDEHQTDSAIRRFIKNVGIDDVNDMIALRIGDRLGGGTQNAVSWRMEEFQKRIKEVLKKPFSISDLKINGKDVMDTLNIPPGKKVGDILQRLFEEVLEDSNKNTREFLLERIKSLMA